MAHTNSNDGQDIRDRTFAYACDVVRLCEALYDRGGVGRLLVPQLVNASTSCASMLEEARAAESDADFISKCGISLKECRETWMRVRVCVERGFGPAEETRRLVQEGNELVSIITAIIRNKRRNTAAKRPQRGQLGAHSKFQIPHSKLPRAEK